MKALIVDTPGNHRNRPSWDRVISRAFLVFALAFVAPAQADEGTYSARLVRQIAKFKRYPDAASALAIAGTTVIHFKLSRDGKLLANQIKESSGDEDLDNAALETMLQAQPFPAAPPETPEGNLEFSIPLVFNLPKLVTSVTGDLHVGAFMAGTCGSTISGEKFSCKFASYYLNRSGVSYFRMPLLDPDGPSREIWFSGSTVQITGIFYELFVDRVLVLDGDRTGSDGKIQQSFKPAKGSCKQVGNFTRRRVYTISCSATDEGGRVYTIDFTTDGTPIKVKRDTDERLFPSVN
jgi:TonB family protein